MEILLYQFGPALFALALAAAVKYLRHRGGGSTPVPLPKAVRTMTWLGMAATLGIMIAYLAWSVYPWWMPRLDDNGILVLQLLTYTAPLALGLVALILLIIPAPSPGPDGTAALAPRTLMTFTPKAWLGLAAGAIVAIVIVSVAAGMASSPDEAGRYLVYPVRITATATASTNIFGWWFSTRSLILVAAIAVLTLIGLLVISRPPFARDSSTDSAQRTQRVRNILAAGTGALLLHLGAVLQSLANTSSLQSSVAGTLVRGTSFAAMGPALSWASLLLVVVGLAIWWSIPLSALPSRTRSRTESALA